MTSRRPEWISVGNLGDRKAQSIPQAAYSVSGAQEGLGHLCTPMVFQPIGEAPSPRQGTILWGRQAPACPTPCKGSSFHQLCPAASTHKALMFSVTTEVYCGSVCGETKCPP